MRSLDRFWLDGQRYMKAGVMLDDFTPDGVSQLNLFDEDKPRANSAKLMKVMDRINQSGLGHMWFARQGFSNEWQMKRELLSPAWTTRWSDIPLPEYFRFELSFELKDNLILLFKRPASDVRNLFPQTRGPSFFKMLRIRRCIS